MSIRRSLSKFAQHCCPHPLRCASVNSVGPSGLLLRHSDRPVRPEPLQQKPDRAPAPRWGLRHRQWRQPGQLGALECAERLRSQPRPRQVPSYLRASVQCSRYVSLSMSPDGLGARSLSPVNCGCRRLDMQLHPQDRMIVCSESQQQCLNTGRRSWLTVDPPHNDRLFKIMMIKNQQTQHHTFHPMLFTQSDILTFKLSMLLWSSLRTEMIPVDIISTASPLSSRVRGSAAKKITVVSKCYQLEPINLNSVCWTK